MSDATAWVSHRDEPLILTNEPQGIAPRTSLLRGYVIRLLDLLIAAGCLALTLPLFLVLPPLIKVDSPGSAFFFQLRLGQGGKPFWLIKFRTMVENQDRGRWTRRGDPRITRLGRLLRKFHVDEVPQFINVIKGEMSVVGPRPYTREVHDQICSFLPEFALRLGVKPGLTGWAQLVGRHGNNPLQHHATLFNYDLRYLSESLTPGAYLEIVARTVWYFFSEALHRTF